MRLACTKCSTVILTSNKEALRGRYPVCIECGAPWRDGKPGRKSSVPLEKLVEALLWRYSGCTREQLAKDLGVTGSTLQNLFYNHGTYPEAHAVAERVQEQAYELQQAGFKLKTFTEDRSQKVVEKLYTAYKAGAITPEKFAEIQPGPDGTRSAW